MLEGCRVGGEIRMQCLCRALAMIMCRCRCQCQCRCQAVSASLCRQHDRPVPWEEVVNRARYCRQGLLTILDETPGFVNARHGHLSHLICVEYHKENCMRKLTRYFTPVRRC
ncbi:uncharacterized protein LOC124355582 [Homalodisca vitripennis]|uniref:uncharacterized protein LOC124355582 n=1 Tax=Homalodisca vitripennis TaxID=197043 RepID=UPI001EEA2911|nr:uncharacterized protein LOC124355582 [Homalodisca vitripennis]